MQSLSVDIETKVLSNLDENVRHRLNDGFIELEHSQNRISGSKLRELTVWLVKHNTGKWS
jgi:hypothetical protein